MDLPRESPPHDRLKEARIGAGHRSAAAFARAAGFNPVTYRAHESGARGLSIEGARAYASALGVSASWLLVGEEMVADRGAEPGAAGIGSAAPAGPPDEEADARSLAELIDDLIDKRRWTPRDLARLAGALAAGLGRTLLRLLRWGLRAGPVRSALEAVGARLPAALGEAGGGGPVAIGRFAIGSAGRPGEQPFPSRAAAAAMPVEPGWLRALTDAAPEDLAFVEAPGERDGDRVSAPVMPGDLLLVDVRARRYGRPGLYLARGRGGCAVVGLDAEAGTGRLTLTPAGAAGSGPGAVEPTDLSLAGRVIWLSRRL